jgi:signal peptidase I
MKKKAAPKTAAKFAARSGIAEWAVTILLMLFATTAVAQPFVIPTGSMEDNLLVGDHVIVDKLSYASASSFAHHLLPYQEPQHGDIIVFRYPPDINQTLVKRLIGLPGDRIKIEHGVVVRNGMRLNEPYIFHKYGPMPELNTFPGECCLPVREPSAEQRQREMLSRNVVHGELVVPPGMYFGMGDNRDNSSDSRFWGFIPRENIIGKPVLIYWSYEATTEDLLGQTPGSVVSHVVDLGQHFFTRTRWSRTLKVVRGVPDSAVPVTARF